MSDYVFDKNLATASTTPARWYTAPEILEQEKTKVFARTWQLVGRAEQVARPGDYFTAQIADEPLIVVRGTDECLRALSNVCRHRAGPVAEGAGTRRQNFQCGYHGWTYALDGRLVGMPEFAGVECWSKEANPLPEFQVETWGGLVFVKLDAAGGPTLAETLGDLPLRATATGEWERMKFAARKDWFIDCNWKVYVDNYLEGYHIPVVHPALNRELDYRRYRVETAPYYSIQHSPIKRAERLRVDERAAQNEAQYFWVFPNLMLNVYPDNYSTNLIIPLGPERTLTVFEWFFHEPEDADTREILAPTVEFSDEIQIEDIRICEAVQRGLRSRTYERGRYSVKRENGVHHFHGLLAEFLSH